MCSYVATGRPGELMHACRQEMIICRQVMIIHMSTWIARSWFYVFLRSTCKYLVFSARSPTVQCSQLTVARSSAHSSQGSPSVSHSCYESSCLTVCLYLRLQFAARNKLLAWVARKKERRILSSDNSLRCRGFHFRHLTSFGGKCRNWTWSFSK